MTVNPLLRRGFETGWIQKFFNAPFDPLNVMLAMRTKLMLDAIDEMGHSYNLLRSIGFGWIDFGDIPGELPGDPDSYVPPGIQGSIDIVPAAGGPAPGEPGAGSPLPGEPGYVPPDLTAEQLAQLEASEASATTLDEAEAAQATAEMQSLANLESEIVAQGAAAGIVGDAGYVSGVGGAYGVGGSDASAIPDSMAAPWGYVDQGLFTGKPGYSGSNAGGWDCCLDETDPASFVSIVYTTLAMAVDETQELSIQGIKDGCPADLYEWSCLSLGGDVTPISGVTTIYTAPAGGAECVTPQIVALYCNGVQVDTISIDIEPCPTSCAIGYTSQQMATNGTQTLSAVPTGEGCGAAAYTWAITSGGGTLNTAEGDTVIYTAPATNASCANNPTIALYCDAVLQDTLLLAINAVTALQVVRECKNRTCPVPCTAYTNCGYCYRDFSCNGTRYPDGNTANCVCLSLGTWDTFGQVGSGTCITGAGVPEGFTDLRSSAQILAGCCPMQLL